MNSILDNHSAYNNFMSLSGNKVSKANVEGYAKIKSFTKEIKEAIGESLKQEIVIYLNDNTTGIDVNANDIHKMIDLIPSLTSINLVRFKKLYSENIFDAFKYLKNRTAESLK